MSENTNTPVTPPTEYTVLRLASMDATPAYPSMKKNPNQKIIQFGKGNMFPTELIEIISKSPVNAAIIDSKITYVCGKGMQGADKKDGDPGYIGDPSPSETWSKAYRKTVTDKVTFGGDYVQVILNKDGSTVSVFHQDFSEVRVGRVDDKGNVLSYKIAKDWKNTSKAGSVIELPVFPGSVDLMKKGQAYIDANFDYRPGLRYYCLPSYYAALEYIKADGELGVFYNNAILNNFTPSVVISMPSNPDPEKKAEFQRRMEAAFTGPRGAASVVIVWGENETVKPDITPFNASTNADVYNNVEAIVFQKIVSSHRLTSPTLAGLAGSGNLSGNAAEIIDAWILFNYTVIEQIRQDTLERYNKFQKINKRAMLTVVDLEVVEKIKEAKNTSTNTINIADGNAPADKEILASKIGVGGVQAITAIMGDANIPENVKRGMLAVVFGLKEDEVKQLFNAAK